MKFLFQSVLLLLSFGFVFVWQQSPLSRYTIQIMIFLILVYAISSFAGSKRLKQFSVSEPLGIFLLNTTVLLFIFSTGGISSGFFFFLYLALFAIIFVFEPGAIVTFIVGAVLVFLPDALKNDVTGNFVKLGSLILISPLAFWLGREYGRDDKKAQEKRDKKEDLDEIE